MTTRHVPCLLLLSQTKFSLGHDEIVEFVNFVKIGLRTYDLHYGFLIDLFGLVGLLKNNIDLLLLSLFAQDNISSLFHNEGDGLPEQVSHLLVDELDQDMLLVAKIIPKKQLLELFFN